ncbi:MAG: DUF554 domain-containing protein [Oscillospiraceae bacterium]|jgi:uncharacterized membrane protein YqgA involved in biofilm formation
MTGTLINTASIIAGSLLGLLLRKVIPKNLDKPIIVAEGIAVIMIGLNGMITRMIKVSEDGSLESQGELLLLISLVIGTVIGELLNVDGAVNRLGSGLEKKLGKEGVAAGFVNASLVFCIGALSIMGPVSERLDGDMTLLLEKSVLDGVSAIILTVGLGIGVMLSSVSVFVIQGIVALFAQAFAGVSSQAMSDFFMVGFAIVMAIGINFAAGTKIKTANLIPSLLVPVAYHLIFA